jgi:hypothetical protein
MEPDTTSTTAEQLMPKQVLKKDHGKMLMYKIDNLFDHNSITCNIYINNTINRCDNSQCIIDCGKMTLDEVVLKIK